MKKHIFHFIPLVVQPTYLIVLVLFKLFCNLKIEGVENLKDIKGRVIFASNHASEWDPLLIRCAFPFFTHFAPFYFVSAPKENFRTFGWKYFIYGGFLFEIFGAYSIHPGHHDYAFSLQNHLQILNKDQTLIIFPQGKRVAPGEESHAHGGVAFLSHKTQSPVVPIHIEGSYGISLLQFLQGNRRVTVSIKKPIQPSELIVGDNTSVEDYKKGAGVILREII